MDVLKTCVYLCLLANIWASNNLIFNARYALIADIQSMDSGELTGGSEAIAEPPTSAALCSTLGSHEIKAKNIENKD